MFVLVPGKIVEATPKFQKRKEKLEFTDQVKLIPP